MAATPGEHLRTRLPAKADSVRKARELIRTLYAQGGVRADPDIVLLLVSELVSNAVLHAQGTVEVSAREVGDVLRVEVRDGSSVLPQVHDHSVDSTNGRGLRLVERLADRWGTEAAGPGHGKTVWFEVGPAAARP
jgi:anti-sigma regulatory factor (Ser/Thr protein kinase)